MSEIIINSEWDYDSIPEIGDGLVVLFTAPTWCVPCQRFEPHWNKAIEFADANKLDYGFVKIDMGETPEDTGEHWATRRFGILGVPQVKRVRLVNGEVEITDIKSRAVIPFLKEIQS